MNYREKKLFDGKNNFSIGYKFLKRKINDAKTKLMIKSIRKI
jgi:hypothetical protein